MDLQPAADPYNVVCNDKLWWWCLQSWRWYDDNGDDEDDVGDDDGDDNDIDDDDCDISDDDDIGNIKGPYADHILIPLGSTGSSVFFGFKWKPIFF